MLHSLSASYGQRPSSFLGLAPTSWEAWQVDVATLRAGRWIEGKLAERDRQGRPVYSLERLLNREEIAGEGFARLGMRARRVHVREDGTWE